MSGSSKNWSETVSKKIQSLCHLRTFARISTREIYEIIGLIGCATFLFLVATAIKKRIETSRWCHFSAPKCALLMNNKKISRLTLDKVFVIEWMTAHHFHNFHIFTLSRLLDPHFYDTHDAWESRCRRLFDSFFLLMVKLSLSRTMGLSHRTSSTWSDEIVSQ